MLLQKIRNLSLLALGAINGLLFALLLELILRALYFWYLYEKYLESLRPRNSDVGVDSYFITSFDLRHYIGSVLTIISIILATVLVSKTLPMLKRTTVLFWQIAGFFSFSISIILGRIHSLTNEYLECGKLHCSSFGFSISYQLYPQEIPLFVFFLAINLGFNLIFSLLLRERKKNFS